MRILGMIIENMSTSLIRLRHCKKKKKKLQIAI